MSPPPLPEVVDFFLVVVLLVLGDRPVAIFAFFWGPFLLVAAVFLFFFLAAKAESSSLSDSESDSSSSSSSEDLVD